MLGVKTPVQSTISVSFCFSLLWCIYWLTNSFWPTFQNVFFIRKLCGRRISLVFELPYYILVSAVLWHSIFCPRILYSRRLWPFRSLFVFHYYDVFIDWLILSDRRFRMYSSFVNCVVVGFRLFSNSLITFSYLLCCDIPSSVPVFCTRVDLYRSSHTNSFRGSCLPIITNIINFLCANMSGECFGTQRRATHSESNGFVPTDYSHERGLVNLNSNFLVLLPVLFSLFIFLPLLFPFVSLISPFSLSLSFLEFIAKRCILRSVKHDFGGVGAPPAGVDQIPGHQPVSTNPSALETSHPLSCVLFTILSPAIAIKYAFKAYLGASCLSSRSDHYS